MNLRVLSNITGADIKLRIRSSIPDNTIKKCTCRLDSCLFINDDADGRLDEIVGYGCEELAAKNDLFNKIQNKIMKFADKSFDISKIILEFENTRRL